MLYTIDSTSLSYSVFQGYGFSLFMIASLKSSVTTLPFVNGPPVVIMTNFVHSQVSQMQCFVDIDFTDILQLFIPELGYVSFMYEVDGLVFFTSVSQHSSTSFYPYLARWDLYIVLFSRVLGSRDVDF